MVWAYCCHFFRRGWILGLNNLSSLFWSPLGHSWALRPVCLWASPGLNQIPALTSPCSSDKALPYPQSSGQREEGKGDQWSGFSAQVPNAALSWEVLNCGETSYGQVEWQGTPRTDAQSVSSGVGGSRWLEELLQWSGHNMDHYWTRIRNISLFGVCRWDVTCRTVSLKGSLPSCSDLLPSPNLTNHCQTSVYPLSYPISPYNVKPVCFKSLIGNMMAAEAFSPEKCTCMNLNLSRHSHRDRKGGVCCWEGSFACMSKVHSSMEVPYQFTKSPWAPEL